MNKWGLGFSPSGWEVLTQKAKEAGYSMENMELAGLVRKKENGEYFDLFRNRVIFPIHSVSGKTIAFAGRKMSSAENSPKYVNSPETELSKKSDVLYGIFQAKNAIKQHNKVFLTEGYTDVITLSQYGIENVVASSGTALTPGQIKLVRRFTPNVTVVYDGDRAGIKASLRGINLLLAEDLNVRVVPLPEGEDPDSYCKALGSEAFSKYLEDNEENFIFFKARLLLEGVKHDPIRKTEAVRDILESLAEIRDPLKRNALNHELARICEMDESLLASELTKLVRSKWSDTGREIIEELKQITESAGVDMPGETFSDISQERALLKLLLLHGDKAFNDETTVYGFVMNELRGDEIIEFHDALSSKIMETFKSTETDEFPGQQYFIQHTDPEIAGWAAGILSEGHELSPAYQENYIYVIHENDNFKQELVSIFVHLRRKKLDNMIRQAIDKLKDEAENAEEAMLLIEYLNTVKMRIAQEVGGAVFHFGTNKGSA
jgi:DNA primase